MRTDLSPGLIKAIRTRTKSERLLVGKAIDDALKCWGNPHLRSAVGIRKLTSDVYECRSGLKTRLVFERLEDTLYFHMMGTHDEVKRFIRKML